MFNYSISTVVRKHDFETWWVLFRTSPIRHKERMDITLVDVSLDRFSNQEGERNEQDRTNSTRFDIDLRLNEIIRIIEGSRSTIRKKRD